MDARDARDKTTAIFVPSCASCSSMLVMHSGIQEFRNSEIQVLNMDGQDEQDKKTAFWLIPFVPVVLHSAIQVS
ncbi:MAG TPA: hypothetical protein VGM81_04480 [Burkholderiaceae bacterium]